MTCRTDVVVWVRKALPPKMLLAVPSLFCTGCIAHGLEQCYDMPNCMGDDTKGSVIFKEKHD